MKKFESGQALLVVLLVMAVGLTISLAIVSRSLTDIKISQQEEESARAFSVAEAGLEEALKMGAGTTGTIGDVTYQVTEVAQGGEKEFVFPKRVARDDAQTIWLVGHNAESQPDPSISSYDETTIEIYWGNEGAEINDATPALEAILIYQDGGDYQVARFPFDPNGGRRATNQFGGASIGSYELAGTNFQFKQTINFPSADSYYALRLRLIYNDESQVLGVKGEANLPDQGNCYDSTATIETTGITRRVQQCRLYKAPSGIFDYVLFSGGDLTK